MATAPSLPRRGVARKRSKTPLVARSTKKPPRASFFGHFGSTNHGNESTFLAMLGRLRSAYPDGDFRCICSNPEAVVARDGIEAIPITNSPSSLWNRRFPLVLRVPAMFVGVGAQIWDYARAFSNLKGTDVLIVPGTGLLTDAYGLQHWGPYSQFRWVLMAKLRRARVLFVSVGAGPIDSSLGRMLTKATLSLADYRSYRDDASRDYLTGIGFPAERDPVYPDLVFGWPETMLGDGDARSPGPRPVVGLGLMGYSGKYSSDDSRPETYTTYLEALAAFAAWLLERGYDIRLLLGDADSTVIEEFRLVLESRFGSYDENRVIEQPIGSIQELLGGLASSDVVVATRFHNVLMAMLLNKPVIAISFHHKCSSLMRSMDLSDYCHDIHDMDADRLISQFRQLEQNREAVVQTIGVGVDEARASLEEQYDRLFAAIERRLEA